MIICLLCIGLWQNAKVIYLFPYVVPRLKEWNKELAATAQLYSENCILDFNPQRDSSVLSFNKVGETFAASGSPTPNFTLIINRAWISGGTGYTYESNTCDSFGACTAYTQVIPYM